MRNVMVALLVLFSGGAATAAEWQDYQIIEWQPRNPAQLATLKQLGVTAGTVIANRDGTGKPVEQLYAPLLGAGLRWYMENITTDFYSAYHRYQPGHTPNWRFEELQRRYQQDLSDNSVFLRDPSLSDPVWLAKVRDRLADNVHEEQRYHPLYYSLGDETGIADLTAFWDFDLSPASVVAMRMWLRQQYGPLAALNAEWGTRFATWNAVTPPTTRQAMRRTDGNFAAWSDFKAWMDVAFADALRQGTDAVHRADPSALAGIEGAQMPGWGGYDYGRLASAVDVMESYDMGDAMVIALSFNPHLVMLTTSFGAERADLHAIWREFLRGSRGLVLWDEDNGVVLPDGTLAPRGQAYAPVFAELRGGLGHRLLAMQRHSDPVAILVSQASFRTQWMLDQQPKGDAWVMRKSETELEDNVLRVAQRGYTQGLTRLGLTPRYVSSEMLAQGALGDAKLLILPHTLALSPAEVAAIGRFVAYGGTVIADVPPGDFDAHGKRQPKPLLVPGTAHIVAPDDSAALARMVTAVGISPIASVRAPAHDVTLYGFTDGPRTVLALQRDLAPADAPETVRLTLPRTGWVTDLRSHTALGQGDTFSVQLDPIAPTILEVSATAP
jgi:hypothetical protein